jgi:hypothetical protein
MVLQGRCRYRGEVPLKVGCGVFPAERPGGLVVPAGEGEQGAGKVVCAGEVVGRDDFLLDDGAEDCDNVQDVSSILDGHSPCIRAAGLPFTRSTAHCADRATCTNSTTDSTESIRYAAISRNVIPQPIPRPPALDVPPGGEAVWAGYRGVSTQNSRPSGSAMATELTSPWPMSM